MLKTILVDDEFNSLQRMRKIVEDYSEINILALYQCGEELLDDLDTYIEELDLLFLDIEMPGIKGLEAAEQILAVDENIDIIFVTAYNEYAVEAFELNALDYLLKPVSKKRFQKTLSRISANQKGRKNEKENLNDDQQHLSVKTFGRTKITFNGEELDIDWWTAKTEELFYFLLLFSGDFVSKDKIIENIWPEGELERSSNLLYTTIYNLRKTFNKLGIQKLILSKRGFYKINAEKVEADIDQLKKMTADVEAEKINAAKFLDELNQIYAGDYLQVKDYCWISSYRMGFNNFYKNILKSLNTKFLNDKNSESAKLTLKMMIDLDPLDEQSYKKLIDIYQSEDNSVMAKRYYEELKDNLKKELDIKPDFEL
jgi:two-component SAPR family response regulator